MNLEELQRKLLEAARREPPSDKVPHAFEQRVMAHVGGAPAFDPLTAWVVGLWRAAFSAVAVCAVVVSLQLVIAGPANADKSEAIGEAPDLEAVLLAPVEASAE